MRRSTLSTSTNPIRSLLLKTALALLVSSTLLAQGINLNQNVSATTVAVNNSTFTSLTCPLDRANFVQIMIAASGTAQVFTFRHTDGSTVSVPSGGSYEIGPLRGELTNGQAIGAVQTATGSTNVQVIAQRVQ